MKETDVADTVQAILERGEGGALRKQHENTVEAFVEVGVFLGFEELEAEIYERFPLGLDCFDSRKQTYK